MGGGRKRRQRRMQKRKRKRIGGESKRMNSLKEKCFCKPSLSLVRRSTLKKITRLGTASVDCCPEAQPGGY